MGQGRAMETGSAFKDWLWIIYRTGEYENQLEFAKAIETDRSTLSRLLDYDHPMRPSVSLLIKLHKLTGVSVGSLVALAYPDQVERAEASLFSLVMAEMLEQLPEEMREVVVAIIRGAPRRGGGKQEQAQD